MASAIDGGPLVAFDDLVSWGTLGLIQAVDRFDGSRGRPFTSFAIPRVRGAIIDGLRQADRVPRNTRRAMRAIEQVREAYCAGLGREPSHDEVRKALGWTSERYWHVTSVAGRVEVPLAEPGADGDDDTAVRVQALRDEGSEELGAAIERHEALTALRSAMNRLPQRERAVLQLLYIDGLPTARVAEVIGVSTTRVCQIKSRSISRLRCDAHLREAA
jgi:RNA polymerase sigma factor for flagellar operon FliA